MADWLAFVADYVLGKAIECDLGLSLRFERVRKKHGGGLEVLRTETKTA